MQDETLELFLRLSKHHRLHPLRKGDKRPAVNDWPNLNLTRSDLINWYNAGYHFGLITDVAAVLDFDEVEPARTFFRENRDVITTVVKTRRGIHFYFRNDDDTHNTTGTPDVRGVGGYVVAPGSVAAGHTYSFVSGLDEIDPQRMTPLKEEWLPRQKSTVSGAGLDSLQNSGDMVYRAREYMKCVPGAISGSGGHACTMKAAGILCQRFGLSLDQAFPIMLEWNDRCVPPWTPHELKHKLESAIRNR